MVGRVVARMVTCVRRVLDMVWSLAPSLLARTRTLDPQVRAHRPRLTRLSTCSPGLLRMTKLATRKAEWRMR